jgi:outer membrane lipoprotein SlyB
VGRVVGIWVGVTVGPIVGSCVGSVLGGVVGPCQAEQYLIGTPHLTRQCVDSTRRTVVGKREGSWVGSVVGIWLGVTVGSVVGPCVGWVVGDVVGPCECSRVRPTAWCLHGPRPSDNERTVVGSRVGVSLGRVVGICVGRVDG